MAEPSTGPITRCPWCSAALSIPGAEECLSCGAHLVTQPGVEGEIKGVTALDPEAILRARADVARPRSRILSFITGDVTAESHDEVNPDSFAPPPDEVRREMQRMQMEADLADLAAETVALKADVLAQRGVPLSELEAQADSINAAIEQIDPADNLPPGTADGDVPPADDAADATPPTADEEPRPPSA